MMNISNGNDQQHSMDIEPETGHSETSTSQEAVTNSGDEDLATQLRSMTESGLCKICKENRSNVVMIPCGHICTCDKCASKLSKCPSCRTRISQIIKAYRA